MTEKNRERFICLFERIGHVLYKHPGLLEKNDQILIKNGINFRNCDIGPGYDVLACFDLEERIDTIKEMGKFDEIQNNPKLALEIIRRSFMNENFNDVLQVTNQYVKGAA